MEFHKCSDFGYKLDIKNNTKLFADFLSPLLSLCLLPSHPASLPFPLLLNSSARPCARCIGTLLVFAVFNFVISLSLRPLQDHRQSSGGRSQDSAEGQDGQVPEQFSGLLHGSSPVCEAGQDPLQLLPAPGQNHREGSPAQGACPEEMQLEQTGRRASGASPPRVLDQSRRVGHPASLPPAHSQTHPKTSMRTAFPRPGGTEEEGDPSGARSRAPPTSRPKAELKLSRSLSKSDSDLLTCSPTEDATMGSRSESLSNCSIGKKRLEKSPSFASEWDEVRLRVVSGRRARLAEPLRSPGCRCPGPAQGPRLPASFTLPPECFRQLGGGRCPGARTGVFVPAWQRTGPLTVHLQGGGPAEQD